ncbi:MAG: hypothetical protein ISP41_02420 [Alphaproteobacteria bacterium]|jgi:hypothetical protein|nr:hypothetical protein [Alphaproteobacteria bacterium]
MTTSTTNRLETDLYEPVKTFLEAQGYEVKAEVSGCDVVAVRGDEPPVVVELKTRFNLELLLQAADRLSVSDTVYIAVADGPRSGLRGRGKRALKLCRMLGFGVLLVRLPKTGAGHVTPVQDPGIYQPRRNPRRSKRLLKEFVERVGDPNTGGATRMPIITAYRQSALRLVASLESGEASTREIRANTGVEQASTILQRNVYGWFDRAARGVYGLSPKGREAAGLYREVIDRLMAA